MNDEETIVTAYAAAVSNLYKVMLTSYATAAGNQQVERRADEAFQAGLELARKVRDRALELVR